MSETGNEWENYVDARLPHFREIVERWADVPKLPWESLNAVCAPPGSRVFATAPTDVSWLIAEVKRLRALLSVRPTPDRERRTP